MNDGQRESPETCDRSIIVLIASGAAGYCVRRYGVPKWQVAVEAEHVIAGIVDYPSIPPNSFGSVD